MAARDRLLWLLAAASAVLALLSCIFVMRQRVLDHDEVELAHTVWRVSLGDVPYRDFFEVHPPFVWMALSPAAREVADARSLVLLLRAISAAGHAMTIFFLCANMWMGRRTIHPLWIAVAVLTMLSSEGNLGYFAELRMDPWPNAALLGAIFLARRERIPLPWRFALFGLIASASQLASPKLPLLVVLFAAAELFRLVRTSRHEAMMAAAAMFAGAATALSLALLVLRAADIDPLHAYTLTVRYHVLLARHGGWIYGLAGAILAQPMISGPAVAGLLLWTVAVVRRELRPNTFEAAAALFLPAELLLVPFPYKQYYTPWLLLAAIFIPFWSLLTDRARPLRVLALPVAVLAVFVASLFGLSFARSTYDFDRTGAYWRLMAKQAGPKTHVVVPVHDHPITARDATYVWFGTTGKNRDYGPEAILGELQVPGISARFTYPHYLRELEQTRPEVIVLDREPDPAFPAKEAAVATYLRAHAAEYERMVVDGRTLFLRREPG